jgi:hypothetical protein
LPPFGKKPKGVGYRMLELFILSGFLYRTAASEWVWMIVLVICCNNFCILFFTGDLEGRNCAEIEEDSISFNGKKNSVNLTEDCPTVTPTVPESVEDKDKGEQEEKDLESVVLTEKGEEDYFVENDDQKREDGEQKKDDEQKEDGEQKKESREEKMTTSLGEMIISQEKMATTQEKMVTSQGADQSSKGSSSSPFLMKIVDESQPSDEEWCGIFNVFYWSKYLLFALVVLRFQVPNSYGTVLFVKKYR